MKSKKRNYNRFLAYCNWILYRIVLGAKEN